MMTYDEGTMYCATDNLDGETGHRHHWHYRHGAPAAVTKQRKNVFIPLVLMCHLTFTPSTVKASSSPSTASSTYQYNKNQDYDIIRHDQGYRVLSHQYESESKIMQQQQQQHTILHGIKKGNEDDNNEFEIDYNDNNNHIDRAVEKESAQNYRGVHNEKESISTDHNNNIENNNVDRNAKDFDYEAAAAAASSFASTSTKRSSIVSDSDDSDEGASEDDETDDETDDDEVHQESEDDSDEDDSDLDDRHEEEEEGHNILSSDNEEEYGLDEDVKMKMKGESRNDGIAVQSPSASTQPPLLSEGRRQNEESHNKHVNTETASINNHHRAMSSQNISSSRRYNNSNNNNHNSNLDDDPTSSSQPLRTLKKLQAMLEETDYATSSSMTLSSPSLASSSTQKNQLPSAVVTKSYTTPHREQTMQRNQSQDNDVNTQYYKTVNDGSSNSRNRNTRQSFAGNSFHDAKNEQNQKDVSDIQSNYNGYEIDRLWTSKDRSKYKKRQRNNPELQREREKILRKQRLKMQEEEERQRRRQEQQIQQQQQQQANTSDDDSTGTDGQDDTDDGLSYILPNLPVYFSDAESTDPTDILDLDSSPAVDATRKSNTDTAMITNGVPEGALTISQTNIRQQQVYPQHQQQFSVHETPYAQKPPLQQGEGPPYQYHTHQQPMHPIQGQSPIPPNQYYPQQQYQQGSQHRQYQYSSQPQTQQGPYNYNYPPQSYQYSNVNAYGPANQQPQLMTTQQGQHQYQQQHQKYGAWNGQDYGPIVSNYHAQHQMPPSTQQQFLPQPIVAQPQLRNRINNMSQDNGILIPKEASTNDIQQVKEIVKRTNVAIENSDKTTTASTQSFIESNNNVTGKLCLTFDSLHKLTFFALSNVFLCYCAVSPRTLELAEYNRAFRNNIHTASLVLIGPILELISIVERKQIDLNSLINTFYASATLGLFFALLLEIISTTLIRLAVFCIWEPFIFSLTPTVPLIVLPWTLRDHKYRPKRITLFAADFTTTCIAAPIIEEYIKLKVMQLSTNLPRNFKRRRLGKIELNKTKKKRKKRKKYIIEEVARNPNEMQVTSINGYVSHMLAASLGMKLADSIKRTMMYTKKNDVNKKFYSVMRGFYPVHELCGTMTALELAKRDVLGLDIPFWRILFPAVFIHGMANLKGMKPLFKWNSKTPWTELQFSQSWWNLSDDLTVSQMFTKGFAKFMWFVILGRVFGYSVKNYYMITRKAIKRTTIFAGKNSAFSAEIKATDALKKLKKER